MGQMGTTGIDFIATKGDHRLYIQVAATMREASTRQRELALLRTNGERSLPGTQALLASISFIFLWNICIIMVMNSSENF